MFVAEWGTVHVKVQSGRTMFSFSAMLVFILSEEEAPLPGTLSGLEGSLSGESWLLKNCEIIRHAYSDCRSPTNR